MSSIIRFIISHNLKSCQNGYLNYVHFKVWSKLKFLSECDTFTLIDQIQLGNNNLRINNLNLLGNSEANKKYFFMLEIFRNNIKDIINFLVYDKVRHNLLFDSNSKN